MKRIFRSEDEMCRIVSRIEELEKALGFRKLKNNIEELQREVRTTKEVLVDSGLAEKNDSFGGSSSIYLNHSNMPRRLRQRFDRLLSHLGLVEEEVDAHTTLRTVKECNENKCK